MEQAFQIMLTNYMSLLEGTPDNLRDTMTEGLADRLFRLKSDFFHQQMSRSRFRKRL